MNRRQFLVGAAATMSLRAHAAGSPVPVVLVVLRGALDGLAAAPLLADPRMKTLRRTIDTTAGALPLTTELGLHPALPKVHARIRAGEGAVVLGVGPGSSGRSHFEAQDTLETGGVRGSGWLNRLAGARGASRPIHLVAVTKKEPVSLSGPTPGACLADPGRGQLDPTQIAELRRLYTGSTDPAAVTALDGLDALEAVQRLPRGTFESSPGEEAAFINAGRLVRAGIGTQAVFLEASGWDTHTRQGAAEGVLARRLGQLDTALDGLLAALDGAAIVVVVTEFGRTAAENGGGGTDHGHGAAALLFGPGVRPGVVGSIPDLGHLYEGRDLPVEIPHGALFAAVSRAAGVTDDLCGGAHPAEGLFRT